MTKITKSQRAIIRQYVEQSASYDASTMRITADGMVTARKDADKTADGNDPARYNVGYASELLTEARAR